ncbi:MAG: hypothetical protein PHS98_02325 [Bacilli bacterium]|nr:hypothetical protein [Bacilli bacterium]
MITDSGNSFAPLSTGNPAVAQSSTVSTTALEVAGTVVMVATGEISSSSNDLGSSSDDPDSIIEIRVDNDLAYGVVEERAKAVYDKYDKNHQPTIDVGASLVAETPEVRELLDQIFNTMPSKDILDGLSVMQRVYKSKPKKRN